MSESIPVWVAKDGVNFKFNHGWVGKKEELRKHLIDLLLELRMTHNKAKVKADDSLIKPTMEESLAFKKTIFTAVRKKKKFRKFKG